ncbi:MAG TPA: hypothetical protein DIW26_01925 [Ruminococcus sp.]|nr:hypothetical protein [Ruminococcus sp.]
MNYFIIEVCCPSVSAKYDFKIPDKIIVKDLIEMIAEDVRIYESNEYLFRQTDKLLLLDENYVPINPLETAEQSGIKNGSILMLI